MRMLIRSSEALAAIATMLLCLAGCTAPAERHQVDPQTARSTLEAVLASWREGATPESWREKSPSVVVQDMDWQRGSKLESFEILSTEAVDANLNCSVKLVLQDTAGKSSKRTVSYLVGTSPVLTVFRGLGP